jgi:branched-chain amino acid transport system permease protein
MSTALKELRNTAGAWTTANAYLRPAAALLAVAALAAMPFVISKFGLVVLSSALILGLFAVGLNIAVGFSGMISLGHAAFFGVGAYASALLFTHIGVSAPIGLLAALAIGAGVGALFALIAQYVRGGYLVMLTIALAQVFASLSETLREITGGSDGLAVPFPSVLPGWGELNNLVSKYWFILAAVVVCVIGLWLVVRSPLGRSFLALKQNEARLESLGYSVLRVKVAVWAISGAAAAYAGSLSAINNELVSTSDFAFMNSALPLLVLCIAGTRSMFTPFIGAIVIVLVRDQLAPYFLGRQILLLGALFVISAYLFPNGVSWQEVKRLRSRIGNVGRTGLL